MAPPNSSAMNAACLRLSPLLTPCICPFLIMFMTSYPCNVRQAVSKEKKPIPGLTSRLMRPMVLLDQVVEIFALSEFTRYGKSLFRFQLAEGFGIRRIFVDGEHSGSHGVASTQRFRKKALRRLGITSGAQMELQGVPFG